MFVRGHIYVHSMRVLLVTRLKERAQEALSAVRAVKLAAAKTDAR